MIRLGFSRLSWWLGSCRLLHRCACPAKIGVYARGRQRPRVELHGRGSRAELLFYMPRSSAAYRRLASRVLSERGIAAVWQLHLDALAAHLAGFPGAAALLLSIADAAEELVWWRTQVTEAPQRN